ncbi:MAG TPA: protein kinase [Vicinamibacteria bacterium]|nr:protein kinase [Vicinamibacteria bacterium]
MKPGNIMLTRSGAKLLDFGLARIAASPAIDSSDVSSSPTESVDQAALTRGRMIGTLQYMAPEQIEGKTADTRTDVFALGAVLYEMLTGTRAFGGSSPPSLMAAILTSDPGPLPAPATNAPPALERLIRTCLAKDPDDRWQSAHDISLQLESMGTETGKADARQARARWPYAGWILLGPALVAVAATALVGRLAPPPPALPIRFPLPPPPGQTFVSTFDTVSFAFSPDGTSLAFIADAPHATQEVPQQPRQGRSSTMIWLRRLSDLEPHPVLGSEGATSLFWSPDGRSIGFSVEGRLRRVEVAGGSPAPICDLPFGGPVIGSWGHDTILLASTFHGVIYTVSPDGGGPPTVLIRCDPGRGETRVVWPYFLPDGKTFLYVAGRKDGTGELMMASLGGPPRAIGPITSRVEYSDPGYLFFAQDGALFAQRFDTKRGRLTGPPLPLAPTVHYFYTSKWAGFAVSRGGALAYAPKGKVSRLAWFDRSGQKLSEVGSAGAGNTTHVSISPDRRQALFDRTRPETGTFDVWMIDLVRGVETRVTSDPNTEFAPVWLPDGRHVVYSVVKEYLPRLVLRDLTDGREEPLLPGGRFQMALDVTPDGRSLLFSQTDDSGTFGLWKLPLVGDRTPLPLVVSKYEQEIARLSRDGRLLAYVSNESGRPEAYVAPLRSPNDKVRLSTNGATGLGWSRDSREVFFTSRDGRLFAMPVVTSPSLRVGAAVPLFDLPAQGWSAFDVAPDGRFLASVQEVSDATEPLTVALNWTEKTSRAIESSGGR